METLQSIINRRSVRKYSEQKIERSTIKEIFETARFAPSWKNCQSFRCHILDDMQKKETFAMECTYEGEHNKNIICGCSSLIVLTYKKGLSGAHSDEEFLKNENIDWEIFDAGIAAQTICLTAFELGIGSVILGIFKKEKVKEFCNIPDDEDVAALIPLGYPKYKKERDVPRKDAEEFFSFID